MWARSAEGEHIFREGDPFDAIAAVRAGTVKTYVNDSEGREQVQGFFLPGEVIGLNAISSARYPCNAVALDPVMLCRFSFPDIAALATRMPGLQQQLFRLLSQDIGKAALLAGNYTADERLAAFLVSLSRRYAARGFLAHALSPHDDAHRHRKLPAPRLRKRQPRFPPPAGCRPGERRPPRNRVARPARTRSHGEQHPARLKDVQIPALPSASTSRRRVSASAG